MRSYLKCHLWLFAITLPFAVLSNTEVKADEIISDVGDRDGFNGAYDPDVQTLPFRFTFPVPFDFGGNTHGGDLAAMDFNSFWESTIGDLYAHSFTLPQDFVISSVAYEIVTFDNASAAQGYDPNTNGRLFFDGVELFRGGGQDFFFDAVGEEYDGASGEFNDGAAELFSVSIDPSLFPLLSDGQVVIEYRGSGPNTDGVAVD